VVFGGGETIEKHEEKELSKLSRAIMVCWFASTDSNSEERSQCVLCCKKPENDYLEINKFINQKTEYNSYVDRGTHFF
jgi:hypothetical protein